MSNRVNREWKLFIDDILESIELIERYIEDMDFGDFKKDRKTVDAVVRNLMIIGEASKYIPDNIREEYSNVDWQGVIGFRNRIIHAYFNISHSIVWHIIKEELPKLKRQMKIILKKSK